MNSSRSFEQLQLRITDFAGRDQRVRAVLLNGSRANANVTPDPYQDLDIVFIVKAMESFLENPGWVTSLLGRPVLQQLPDSMLLGQTASNVSYAYLMIFEDGSRVDLTLFPRQLFDTHFKHDSLTVVWLDKDGLFAHLPPSSDIDYHVRRPDEREFSETCNEFWWTSTYVAKGLLRGQIVYAKAVIENNVRPMLLQLLGWRIGIDHDFKVATGPSGKQFSRYLSIDLYHQLLTTYANADDIANWEALIAMMNLFGQVEKAVAEHLNWPVNHEQSHHSKAYVLRLMNVFRNESRF